MEGIVLRMIAESATRLGLDASDPNVLKANEIGVEAVRNGFDADDSFGFARRVLIEATQPGDIYSAA